MSWQFEIVAGPMQLTEGPVWDGGSFLYTNIANNRIMRFESSTGESAVVRKGTNDANGLMFGNDKKLYACEGDAEDQSGRRIVCYDPIEGNENNGVNVIVDNFEGKRFNSPNDLAIDSRGCIWFSDPRYSEQRADMELDHESVFRAEQQNDNSWTVQRMTFDTTCPNGLLVSPDEKTLYVAESKYGENQKRELRAYPILEDGTLGAYRVLHNFYPHRGIDGMCFDSEGNIVATAGWEVSGPGGMIYVFAPNGRILETHPMPSEVRRPTNCTFGGDGLSTLFVTSVEGYVLVAQTDRSGLTRN